MRCGEKETRSVARLRHSYVTTTGNSKSNATYCLHCGRPKADSLSLGYDDSKQQTKEITERNRIIDFVDILRNWWLYTKSFFTGETTRVQKIKHFVGLSFFGLF